MPKTQDTNGEVKKASQHIAVLKRQVLSLLGPKEGQSYLDVTAGYGGHAKVILEHTLSLERAVLVDRDSQAVDELKKLFGKGTKVIHSDFWSASKELLSQNQRFDMIFADLGMSSLHIDSPHRGFAINQPGPLDMRMDQRQEFSADTIVNKSSETELVEILRCFGQEPKAREIARRIVSARPIGSTQQLAAVAAKAWPGHSKVHPATRTFQAIRIAVNQELLQLERSLPLWLKMLTPGGRLAVISFHSLEDRLVKQFMAENARSGYEAELKLLTKKPVMAKPNEIVSNPRARSARLRAAVKIKTKIERVKGKSYAYQGNG